ncbi:MAG: glycoside hydrolase family 3 C-terminal domain-containing protein [Ignavibacteriales bacterium]|nr:glycoside hydrolase family 3 C-terminal domain-containing protein [Ignavibacteriales bacterium]
MKSNYLKIFKNIIFLYLVIFLLNSVTIAQDIEQKAKDLISKLTLEEKIGLTVGDGKFLESKISQDENSEVPIANRNSRILIPRLNIRNTSLTDGPAGINKSEAPEGVKDYTYTTAFPTSTCLAASWNTELIQKVGEALGNELLEYDYDLILMPALNLHRDPNCGRNFEYYSEDPLLSGKISAAMVNGIQSKGVGATLKHFLANNQESNRRKYNAVVSQRALREIYLKGFEIAVKESQPKAIMTSYNKLNGYYTAERPELLNDVVRKEWGFDGLYMTDFDMHYGDAVAQVRAGLNMIMGGSKYEYDEITEAIKKKNLVESVLDENLIYNMKLKLTSPSMNGHTPTFKPDLEDHAKLARQAASEGIVLLKNNDGLLPLKNKMKIALFGKISYYPIAFGTGSGGVRSFKYRVSVNDGLKNAGFETLDNMEKIYNDYIEKIKRENLVPPYFDNPKMRKDNGIVGNQAPAHFKNRLVAFSKEMDVSKYKIKEYESKSDIAIITLGRSAGENYENGYIPITEIELNLVKNISEIFHSAGKKVIVVLNIGGVWETASWRDYADAILLLWQPGQEGGNAVADIISGNVNPSGKLPDSFPLKYEDVPSSKSFPGQPIEEPINSFYEEGIYVGYRYYNTFNVPSAYEFGYGLSYTTFKYSDLKLSSSTFSSEMEINVKITNTGKVPGKEVVQLYVAAPQTEIEKPVRELKGFAKTNLLQPGESQIVTFNIDAYSLASFWSGLSSWITDKGEYEVQIGASSTDIKLKDKFNVPEKIVVKKVHDVLYPNFMMKELSQKDK